MSQVKFLVAPGKHKINAAFVLQMYKSNDYGKVILFDLIDQRTLTWTFETEEERDAIYEGLGKDSLDEFISDIAEKLKPELEALISRSREPLYDPHMMHVPGEGDPMDAYPSFDTSAISPNVNPTPGKRSPKPNLKGKAKTKPKAAAKKK